MKAQYILWFDYDLQAHKKIIHTALAHIQNVGDDVLKLMSHSLAAHEIWNSRIQNRPATVGVWERIPAEKWLEFAEKNYQNSLLVLDAIELDTVIHYANTKGDTFENTVADIYSHVVMHAMYHRGQVARSLRESDIAPPDTNFISFRR